METEKQLEAKVGGSYAAWSVVQLMGHVVYAGFATEVSHFGATMLRLDVPEVIDQDGKLIPSWSKLIGGAAIYDCTPVGEDEARIVMQRLRARPLKEYILPYADKPMTMRLLPGAPNPEHEDDDRDYDDDEDEEVY